MEAANHNFLLKRVLIKIKKREAKELKSLERIRAHER
jgi:hypothetical protein